MQNKMENSEITRKNILNVAKKMFSQKGYANTKLSEISKEIGMTRGAIYWHFKDKYQLYEVIIDSSTTKLEKIIYNILDSDMSPQKKIKKLIIKTIFLITNNDYFQVFDEFSDFKNNSSKELNKLNLEHKERSHIFKKKVIKVIKNGISEDKFDKDCNPEIVVIALLSYLAGIRTLWLSKMIDLEKNDFLAFQENAEEFADIFIHGLKGT